MLNQAERFDCSKLSSLNEVLADYELYTPALMHLSVPLRADPFHDFCVEQNRDVQRWSMFFDKPIFDGLTHPLGDRSWNHVLMAMLKPDWEVYRQWAGTLAFNNSAKGIVQRIRTQDISIGDPLKLGAEKTIPVTAFVVESNRGSFYFNNNTDLPTAKFDPALVWRDTVAFAKAIQHGGDPYKEANAAVDSAVSDD